MSSAYQAPPRRLLITAIVVTTLTYFPVGYHHSVLNVAHEVFEQFINESFVTHYSLVPSETTRSALWSVSVSVWEVGAAVASLNAFWVVERYGRKRTLLIFASALQIIGSLLMAIAFPANAFEMLIVGRFFCGLSAGLVCPSLRIFMSECSPDVHRGTLNSIAGFVMFVASLTAMGLGMPECFGTSALSPILCGFCIVFSFITLGVYRLFPRTPKYLYLSRCKSVAAAKSLKFYHGSHIDVGELFGEFNKERSLTTEHMSFKDAMNTKTVRLPLFLSAFAGLAFSCTGMDVFDAYSTEMFEYVGLPKRESQLASALFNIPGLLGAVLALICVERISRRKLIIGTLAGCFLFMVSLVIVGVIPQQAVAERSLGITAALFVALLTLFYSMGPNAVLESLFAEVAPHRIRNVAGTVSEVAFWVSDTLFVFLFPLSMRIMGYYSFLMLAVPLGVCLVYFYFYLPDSKGKSVYEVAQKLKLSKTESSVKILEAADSTSSFLNA